MIHCRVFETSFVEEDEDDDPFEFDIEMANPGVEREPEKGEDKPEPEPMDVEEEPEPEDDDVTSAFMINITQMAGTLEVAKQFLLPLDEEVRRRAGE